MGSRRAKNLLLDAEALNRAEAYCRHQQTNLSRLVEDFLLALPGPYDHESQQAKSPIVRRLDGAANMGPFEADPYRDFLYGSPTEALDRERDDVS